MDLSEIEKLKLPFSIHAAAEQCQKCIIQQLEKYKHHVDQYDRSVANRFVVDCHGIPKEPIDPRLKSMMSLEEWEQSVALFDPVIWAKANLTNPDYKSWEARWYQAEVMRCTSARRALRISRRTGKTDMVAVEICFRLFSKKNQRIIVAAPQKVHVEEILNRIRGFIYRNPALADSVRHDVSSPIYKLELGNDSYVRGFALGTRGKTEGLSVRGQNADFIFCDEMDYVDEKAIVGGLFPILQTTPETRMTGFSTPTGFKSIYYSICADNPHYREFHYNYKVLPHWKSVEQDRNQYTEEEWTHEHLAEWGASEEGVFKPAYVDRSLRGYNYADLLPARNWRYIIGADWNEKHGAEIVVVGENVPGGFYQVVDAFVVEKTEFTQLASIDALMNANRKWSPAFIFVDAGNGSTNYELLRKKSFEQRRPGGDKATARLLDILYKYDAGKAIETKDPVTGEPNKSPAKPFMVNAAVRAFEGDKVRISSADKTLEKQLRNYIIDRISPTGTTVYGTRDKKIGDHRLDAFNLAMVGFYLQFGGLKQPSVLTDVAATVNPITKRQGGTRSGAVRSDPLDRGLSDEEEARSVIKRSLYGASIPARIGSVYKVAHNNPGWATDEEDKYEAMYAMRRRNRRKVGKGRPTRANLGRSSWD
jgi:hypothetical protein